MTQKPKRFIAFRRPDGNWTLRDTKTGREWVYWSRDGAVAAARAANR